MTAARDTHSPDVIPIGEAARLLGVSVDTIRRWDREGRLSSFRTVGGQRRFYRTDVESLREAGEAA